MIYMKIFSKVRLISKVCIETNQKLVEGSKYQWVEEKSSEKEKSGEKEKLDVTLSPDKNSFNKNIEKEVELTYKQLISKI